MKGVEPLQKMESVVRQRIHLGTVSHPEPDHSQGRRCLPFMLLEAEEGAVSQAARVPRVRRIVGELPPAHAGDIGEYRLSVHDLPLRREILVT